MQRLIIFAFLLLPLPVAGPTPKKLLPPDAPTFQMRARVVTQK